MVQLYEENLLVFFLDWYDGQIAAGRREDVILWHELESEYRER